MHQLQDPKALLSTKSSAAKHKMPQTKRVMDLERATILIIQELRNLDAFYMRRRFWADKSLAGEEEREDPNSCRGDTFTQELPKENGSRSRALAACPRADPARWGLRPQGPTLGMSSNQGGGTKCPIHLTSRVR